MVIKPTAKCPVCDNVLGSITKSEVNSFVCRECKWIFTWNSKGKLSGTPVKVEERKEVQKCDCGGCQFRDEQKRWKNNPLM